MLQYLMSRSVTSTSAPPRAARASQLARWGRRLVLAAAFLLAVHPTSAEASDPVPVVSDLEGFLR
jgi:hypothetical protein